MPKPERYYSQQSQQYLLVDNPGTAEYQPYRPESTEQYRDTSRPSTPSHVYDERSATPSHVYDEPSTQTQGYAERTPPPYNSDYDFANDEPLKAPVKTKRVWSRRRKFTIFGGIAAFLVIAIGIAVGVAVYFLKYKFSYTPSFAQVTNDEAFTNGGATHTNVNSTDPGSIGAGQDKYTYYTGTWDTFPKPDEWVSFDDMWKANEPGLHQSCEFLGYDDNNSPQNIQDIYDAIQNRANASLVDHRFIFAVILQESHGCVHVHSTNNGIVNPGLMQSHGGESYNPFHKTQSILAMVQDGTQGTSTGDGLVQTLNQYGNYASAARAYNSGYIPKSGDLSQAAGATACYVSDIANRLTGWTKAKSLCPGDDE